MARGQVLAISTRRLLSATRPPPYLPPHSIRSRQLTSAGDDKISFSGTTKEEKIDCFFKTAGLIDARKSAEEEKLGIMLHKCKTIKQLKEVHLQMLINRLRSDVDKNNSNYYLLADRLMILSSDLISFDYAYKVFMDLPSNPSLCSYNTLIKCSIGKSDNIAASAYNRMRNLYNISPDRFTLAFLLKSLASFDRLESGEMVHGQVIKLGFVSDTFVMNSLLEFYFKFVVHHYIRAVKKVFDEMHERDIVSWNTMISGLENELLCHEALSVFDDMLLSADHRCKPDETTLINILSACTRLLFVEPGKWLDAYIKENEFVLSLPLGNALIEMFVRFNDLGKAKMVFKSMSKRCTITWQRMMLGLVGNGFCNEAIVLFDTMCCCSVEEGGLKPDNYIFKLLLSAFTKDERLVGDGKRLFRVIHQMVRGFGVKPDRDNYHTMIMIFAEAGWVEAAMMLAESLPWAPDNWVWGHVLYACQVHGNDLLLDSWIRKLCDINSSNPDYRPPTHFLKMTLRSYIFDAFRRRHNNDVSYAKSLVESLIRKLPDQKHVDFLNECLEDEVKRMASAEACTQRRHYSTVHAQQTLLPHRDDICKALQSLDRHILGNSHDERININDDPCQLDI